MNFEHLEKEINNLLSLKTEGGYWDFKEAWHSDKVSLLHDIICMANNLENRDAYIIIGVEDETWKVKGNLNNDKNRKNQQNLINFIRDKDFSGGIRPIVYLRTIGSDDMDVIIIKNTKSTPYYLNTIYMHGQKSVLQGNIYTRVGDENTPRDKTADIDKVSYLWRKRFGFDLTPFEKAKFLLGNPKDWIPMGTDGIHTASSENHKRVWFNNQFPEFTLSYTPKYFSGEYMENGIFYSIDKIDQNLYWLAAVPTGGSFGNTNLHNTYYWDLSIKYANSTLYSTPMITADNFRFERVQWKNDFIINPDTRFSSIVFSYIEKDNVDFLLDNWLAVKQETIPATENVSIISSLNLKHLNYFSFNPYTVVPVFDSAFERKEFMTYIETHKVSFFLEAGSFNPTNSQYNGNTAQAFNPDYISYLCSTGKMIVEWLDKWKKIDESKSK